MHTIPTRYLLLRDRRNWEGVPTIGLSPESDGVLTLARLPGIAGAQPIVLAGPYEVETSGVAVGAYGDLYIADTANHRIIRIDGVCSTRVVLPGAAGVSPGVSLFGSPRGLLVGKDNLYVADRDRGRVLVFRLPTLELRAVWDSPLQNPTGLAIDSRNRIYVLDRGLKRVLRFSPLGAPDEPYNTAMAAQPTLVSPSSLAVGDNDVLYVSDEQSNTILRFDHNGIALSLLPVGSSATPIHPRALAAHGGRLYVADAEDGRIWVFECRADAYLGALHGYRGSVAAMTMSDNGTLFIKPGLDETVHKLQPETACASSGELLAGPFDAGEGNEWERVSVKAEIPDGTDVALYLFASDTDSVSPGATDWRQTLSLDTLVQSVLGFSNGPSTLKRFLWLRVLLKSDDQRTSPRLLQVQAETIGESYLQHLPAVYARDNAPHRFLERWLALFRGEFGDLELALDEMAQRFDPATAPEDFLPWLASWLAFDLPPDGAVDATRELLLRVHDLYSRRGTPQGLREWVELYAGVRPHIFEAFRKRRIWQLRESASSALGFDTVLAPSHPDGMIVPGFTLADPHYMGLRGDYYQGTNFERLILSRTDPDVNFDWEAGSPDASVPSDRFSVRWTGQLLARFSETYTFYVTADDGVRLWVDGGLIVDQWIDQSATEHYGSITLSAGRWYPIQLEYYERTGRAVIRLSWASRSQRKEIIPQSQLYSIRDDHAQLEPPEQTLLVGQTVVGQTGPLARSDFGIPLFSDTAHLFTVSIPAAKAPDPSQRAIVRRVIESEKPAHTDFHLCFVEPRMRVGFQARIGIDSIIAGPPEPMELDGTILGFDSYVGVEAGTSEIGRIGQRSTVGQNTVIG